MDAKRDASTWGEQVRRNANWVIVLGVLQIVFGVLAIGSPLVTGVAVAWIVGLLLMIAGVGQIVQAFKAGSWGAGALGFLFGIFALLAGLVMLGKPLFGLASLTLVLAFYFLINGVTTLVLALRLRPRDGWGWILFNGVVTLLLAILIWRNWPLSGAWAIGTLVGIHILLSGWSTTAIGLAARRLGS
jgi:uncharacterized membrane protein HdeD (DUF308 family)